MDKVAKEPNKVFFGQIILNQGVNPLNFYGLAIFITISFFTTIFVELVKVMLLTGKQFMNLSNDEAALEVGNILLAEKLFGLISNQFIGILNDKWGRKNMFIIMVIISCVSIYMMPYIKHPYPWFLVCRIGQQFLSQLLYASPLQGDYIESASQGKASSILSFFGGIGYMSVTAVSTQISGNEDRTKQAIIITSIVTLVVSLVCGMLLKQESEIKQTQAQVKTQETFIQYVKNSTKLLIKSPWLLIGICIILLDKTGGFIQSSYIQLWVKKFYNEDQQSESNKYASVLQFKSSLFSTLFAIFLGYFFDRYSKKLLVILTYILAVVGSVLFIIIDNPFSIWYNVTLITLALGQASFHQAPQYLFNIYTTYDNRGLLKGYALSVSLIGSMIISYAGTYLFTVWSRLAPMYIFLMLASISGIFCLIIYIFKIVPSNNNSNINSKAEPFITEE